jgi:hypothetical protein
VIKRFLIVITVGVALLIGGPAGAAHAAGGGADPICAACW